MKPSILRTLLMALVATLALAVAPRGAEAGAIAQPGVGKQDCTYTIGYWKTHPDSWPLGSLALGNITYNQAQLGLIFSQPVQGNGLVSLSQQLIAAKFNVAQGADPATVQLAITQADALIGARVCPPIGTGALTPAQTSSLGSTLDSYNNGLLGPYHCGSQTAARQGTWGSLKSIYR
ncbi:MAG: hypothetical protein U0704_05565 [Candidatus Eisenbacteria bacterium]